MNLNFSSRCINRWYCQDQNIDWISVGACSMRGYRKLCQGRGSNFFKLFSLMREERIQIPLKAGHRPPTSETPFRWRFAKWRFGDGPMMAKIECWLGSFVIVQEIRTIIAKKPYIFCFFSAGASGPPVPTSGSAHVQRSA